MTIEAVAGRRRATSLGGVWDLVDADDGLARRVPAPAPWQAAFADLRWLRGSATCSRHFACPDGSEGREVALRFGAASEPAEFLVNGERIAIHEGGWLPFEAVVPWRPCATTTSWRCVAPTPRTRPSPRSPTAGTAGTAPSPGSGKT